MERNSLVPAAAQELWNKWEIHSLILASLFLQVFLFLFAGMRSRSSSRLLGIVLWLAYLSADSVAIFVLGHLAVRAGEPGHQLMSFWAPFVLVHLGGQDTITALSRQDNELWLRHLLNLVTQTAVAGYVVAKTSWPDHRLRAAMVVMFLSGFFKYAERTGCLYFASPAKLRSAIMDSLSSELLYLQRLPSDVSFINRHRERDADRRDEALISNQELLKGYMGASRDIMSVDTLLNDVRPELLKKFQDRNAPYEFVGAGLLGWYKRLYTKNPLRETFYDNYRLLFLNLYNCSIPLPSCDNFLPCPAIVLLAVTPALLYPLFQYVSTPIALVLFWAAEKGGRQSSRADIAVSYTLLIGAIVLDVASAITLIFSFQTSNLPGGSMIKRATLANCIQSEWRRKQWSEELAQYNMIKRHSMQHTSGMGSIRQWIGGKLSDFCGIELFDVTHTTISKDDTPTKEFILDNLSRARSQNEWNIASVRGHQAVVQNLMKKHQDPESATIGKILEKNITSVDFPTSVLIWHIATDICYFGQNEDSTSSSDHGQEAKKHKEMSRELSNYIMYLVFKCGVMLTSNSQFVHEEARREIRSILLDEQGRVSLGEKAAVMKLFDAKERRREYDPSTVAIRELEEQANNNNNAADSSHLQKIAQSAKAITSPVLPRARQLAEALNRINCEAERWELIATVWSEMLFYTAPRCGCAFHYEHLSTGGEFVTHVLLLMKTLGPFLPPPGA